MPIAAPIAPAITNAPAVKVATPPSDGVAAPITPPDFSAGQLNNPGPAYPYKSRKAHEQGVVLLKVLVSTDGRAKTLQIQESSGFGRLDREAMKTVRKWRFVPASQAGKPREAWVLVPVTFSLG
ncbi:TonB family protein [Altererythrobacter endophyticus]|uniref:TonB family protein n=2 Tax=Altericroceibacterium endophyticum TaxID=1808508 RepID=A0A6I4T5G0_9SPHN|nr:TonB family protein [Altericroceibacterium endophyticum]